MQWCRVKAITLEHYRFNFRNDNTVQRIESKWTEVVLIGSKFLPVRVGGDWRRKSLEIIARWALRKSSILISAGEVEKI